MFQESLKGVSKKIKEGFSRVLSGFQVWDTFKGDSREFQGNLEEVQKVFQRSFKDVKCVSGKFQKLSKMFH